jgi:hypothetical protein
MWVRLAVYTEDRRRNSLNRPHSDVNQISNTQFDNIATAPYVCEWRIDKIIRFSLAVHMHA